MKAILLIITFCLCHLVAFSQIRGYEFDDGHGKYGFKDKNEKFIIKGLEYARWDYSAKVGVYAKTDRNKRGVLNEYGKEIIPCIYYPPQIQTYHPTSV
ncbi:MAG: hypothetical protein IKO99_12120 [Bacteroidales bacterium]|nr:hypothetical protein [Bacteroidales bacterium]